MGAHTPRGDVCQGGLELENGDEGGEAAQLRLAAHIAEVAVQLLVEAAVPAAYNLQPVLRHGGIEALCWKGLGHRGPALQSSRPSLRSHSACIPYCR